MRSTVRRSALELVALLWIAVVAGTTCPEQSQAQAAEKSALERALNGLRWRMSEREVLRRVGAEGTRWGVSLPYAELAGDASEHVLESRSAFARTWHIFTARGLSKLLMAFEPLTFPEGNFSAFAASLQRRFGAGEHKTGKLASGSSSKRSWIEWHDQTTRLRAIDETNHRGAYILIFEPRSKALTH